MGRYEIALKKPAAAHQDRHLQTFGIDDDSLYATGLVDRRRKMPVDAFSLEPRENALIRIVFSNPAAMFKGTQVHYHEPSRTRFLCKQGICCRHQYPGAAKPYQRVGCTIAVRYPGNPNRIEIVPWIFGKAVFNRLKDLNRQVNITEQSFRILRDPGGIEYVHNYSFMPSPHNHPLDSIEVNEEQKQRADVLFQLLLQYFGRDMTEEQIEDMLLHPTEVAHSDQPRRSWPSGRLPTGRARRPIQEEATRPPDVDISQLLNDI